VTTGSTIKDLGVILEQLVFISSSYQPSYKNSFFHLRNISKLGNMLSTSDAEKLVHAFMTSRLNYCNALQGGCPASLINKLQLVQNAAARILTRSRKYDHITPIFTSLHWLPVRFQIHYKLLILTYKTLTSRTSRSQNSGLLVVHRIAKSKGSRSFSHSAPNLWNSL
ncbi:hypothetical protein C0J50_11732, partial [Silurus asotus]